MARHLLIPLVFVIVLSPVLAQDEAKKSDLLEEEALTAESRGDYKGALEAFERAFAESVKEAGKAAGAKARARDLAKAEFHLEKIARLTEKTSRFGKTRKFLTGFGTDSVGPSLKAWIDWYKARALVAEGKLEEARALMGDFGFLTDWWVAGSFDNERGGGFAKAAPPESGPIDLDAKMKGKEREVGWRRVVEDPIYGYFDLDALLRPNDQCLAYAVAYLSCPDDRPAALRLASHDAVKAFLNGREVLAKDAERVCTLDQDIVGIRLRKGMNRLVLKVCDRTGAWGFIARFTTPDGSPMTDLAVSNTREAAAAAEAELAAAGALAEGDPVAADGGGKAVLEEREADADARTLFRLGYLHIRRKYEDHNLRRAEKLLEKAQALEPENPFISFLLAEASQRKVAAAVEKEENKRRHALERAVELDRGYAEAYYLLAHYYTYSLPLYAKAETNLARCLAVNPKFLDARLLEIDLLRRRGMAVEADVKLATLVGEDEFADMTPFLRRRADYAGGRNQADAARKAVDRALATDHSDGGARARRERMLKTEGNLEGVLALYAERLELDPFDLRARTARANLLEGLGRYEDAAAAALEALELCPEDDGVLNQVGRLYHKLGDEEKTLAFWKRALELNPKIAQLRRYVEFVDPDSRPFEDAFPVELAPHLAKAREFESTENDPWVKVLDQKIDKVNPDGTVSSFHRLLVKILNVQGIRTFDRYGPRFSRNDQAVHWRTARVHKPDGSTVEGRIVSGWYTDLPRLTEGDVIQLEYRLDELKQSFFGDYYGQSFFFGDWVPCLESEFVVIAPEDKELFFHTRNLDLEPEVAVGDEGRTKRFTFRLTDVPKVRTEPNMPSPREVFPQVNVSNYRSWDDFARWYWNLIKNQLHMNDELRKKLAEVVEGKETRYDKVRAVYDFVITDIRYDASWEFGVHGYQPYDATAIYARKFGDCKDKAILTTTLLRELGIDAYPVLIYAGNQRWDEDLTLPMVNHFNHAISYVPDVDGEGRGMFLDGTAQYTSIESVPGMDRGARVLIVKPDGGEILQVPWLEPDTNHMRTTLDVQVAADGTAAVAAEMSFGGDYSVMIRSAFAVEGQREMRLSRMIGQMLGQAELGEFEFTDLKDLSVTTAGLELDAKIASFGEKTPRGIELKVTFNPNPISPLASAEERKWDLVLGPPSTQEARGIYRLPPGYVVKKLPEDVTVETPFGSVKTRFAEKDGVVTFSRVLQFVTNRIPVGEYEKLREFTNAWDVSARERIVIDKE